MAQGWDVDSVADTITFYEAPANGAAIVIRQYASTSFRATPVWAFGAWSTLNGWPREVEYVSDRLVFAGNRAQPQTEWMTKTGDYTNFGKSVPTADDDAITVTLNARKANEIREIVPLDNPIVNTSGAEWRQTAGQDDVLTPSTVGFKPQSYNGIGSLPAIVVNNVAIYVQERGYVVRDIAYQFDVDGYTGNNLAVFAGHLVEGFQLLDLTFQQLPYSIAWFVRDDGKLLALTYLREQTVLGWAPQDTDGVFESVCAIPEGAEDGVYVVVRRTVDGVDRRYIERMQSRIPPWAPMPRGAAVSYRQRDTLLRWFVDSGLSYDGRNRNPAHIVAIGVTTGGWTENDVLTLAAFDTGTGGVRAMFVPDDIGDQVEVALYTTALDQDSCQYVTTLTARIRFVIDQFVSSFQVRGHTIGDFPEELRGGQLSALSDWTFKRNVFSGLDHLIGKTVSVYSDGNVHPQRVVDENGSITLQEPGGVVIVGLPYCSDLETLELNVIGGQSIRGAQKLIKKLTVQVQESRNIVAGPSFDYDKMEEWKPRDVGDGYEDAVSEVSGVAKISTTSSWSTEGHICLRNNLPLPLTVLAVIPELDTGSSA